MKAATIADGTEDVFWGQVGFCESLKISNTDAQGFAENEKAAKDGGKIAGDARRALEKKRVTLSLANKTISPVKKQKRFRKRIYRRSLSRKVFSTINRKIMEKHLCKSFVSLLHVTACVEYIKAFCNKNLKRGSVNECQRQSTATHHHHAILQLMM